MNEDARIEMLRINLNLAATFAAAGRPYAELDADGNVVIRVPEKSEEKA